jgi:hypothetical protein
MKAIPIDVIVTTLHNGRMRPTRFRYVEPQSQNQLKYDIKRIVNVEEFGRKDTKKLKFTCIIEDEGYQKEILLSFELHSTRWIILVNGD